MTRFRPRAALPLMAAVLFAVHPLRAQQSVEADKALLASEQFVKPPSEVAKLVTAPRQQNSTLTQQSPDKKQFLVIHAEGLGSEAKFARPHVYLGGLQVDERANRVCAFTTRGQAGIEIVDAESGARTTVQMPANATASSPAWSPDGSKVAYFANFDDASYVYVADAKTGSSKRLSERAALPVLATQLDWAPDGSAVYAVLVPDGRGPVPKELAVADGPLVRMTNGQKRKTPTYASLLESPFQKAQLEYYGTGQLARIDVKGGARNVGAAAMIESVDVSPDGKHMRVTITQKPFSYLVPVASFGAAEQLWTSDGKVVATLSRRALREGNDAAGGDDPAAARAAADTGKRAYAWTPSGGLAYLLQDPAPRRGRGAGAPTDSSDAPTADSTVRGPRRKDRLYVWSAPFDSGRATPIADSDNRLAGFVFSTDNKWVLMSESANNVTHTYAVSLADPTKKRTIFRAAGAVAGFGGTGRGGGGGGRGGAGDDGFYANPGSVVLRTTGSSRLAMIGADGNSGSSRNRVGRIR